MSNMVIVEANTNSEQDTPEAMKLNRDWVTNIISKYSNIINWDLIPKAYQVVTNEEPEDLMFCETDGEEDNDENYNYWEFTCSRIGKDSIQIIFCHKHSGDELFCEVFL
mgnify:CR=1 FL=1